MSNLILTHEPGDLAWMQKVHRPDEILLTPVQVPPARIPAGRVLIPWPHGLCVRGDVACVHRGQIPGLVAAPAPEFTAWVVRTFFATAGLRPIAPMSRDGFERWVHEAPKPVVTRCTACNGSGVDPDGAPVEDGIAACKTCGGDPVHVDEHAASELVGPVRVVASALAPLLPHLGPGQDVFFGFAPSVAQEQTRGPLPLELHVRVRSQDVGCEAEDGWWRLTVLGLPDDGLTV